MSSSTTLSDFVGNSTPTKRNSSRSYFSPPEEVNGWTRTVNNDEKIRWWKKGSTSALGDYTKVEVFHSVDSWYTKTVHVDRFGFVTSESKSKRFKEERYENPREEAVKSAVKEMKQIDVYKEFDSPPSLPKEIGGWVLEKRERTGGARWRNEDEIVEIYRSATPPKRPDRYTFLYEKIDNEKMEVLERTRKQIYRSVVRFMRHFPNGIEEDVGYSSLLGIDDIGPSRARKLQLVGVRDRGALERALEDTADVEQRETVKKVLTKKAKESLDELIPTTAGWVVADAEKQKYKEDAKESLRVKWEKSNDEDSALIAKKEGGWGLHRSFRGGEYKEDLRLGKRKKAESFEKIVDEALEHMRKSPGYSPSIPEIVDGGWERLGRVDVWVKGRGEKNNEVETRTMKVKERDGEWVEFLDGKEYERHESRMRAVARATYRMEMTG